MKSSGKEDDWILKKVNSANPNANTVKIFKSFLILIFPVEENNTYIFSWLPSSSVHTWYTLYIYNNDWMTYVQLCNYTKLRSISEIQQSKAASVAWKSEREANNRTTRKKLPLLLLGVLPIGRSMAFNSFIRPCFQPSFSYYHTIPLVHQASYSVVTLVGHPWCRLAVGFFAPLPT